jgi:hypothetical protein
LRGGTDVSAIATTRAIVQAAVRTLVVVERWSVLRVVAGGVDGSEDGDDHDNEDDDNDDDDDVVEEWFVCEVLTGGASVVVLTGNAVTAVTLDTRR